MSIPRESGMTADEMTQADREKWALFTDANGQVIQRQCDEEGFQYVRVVSKPPNEIYETEVTGAVTTDIAECVVTGDHLHIRNIILSGANGAGIASATLQYWDGVGWNTLVILKFGANQNDHIAVPIKGDLKTGIRNTGEDFIRLVTVGAALDAALTVLGFQDTPPA